VLSLHFRDGNVKEVCVRVGFRIFVTKIRFTYAVLLYISAVCVFISLIGFLKKGGT
jgi:hypothetical protein